MGLERLAAGAVQVPRQPADPGQHLHRRHVEVGAFPAPGLEQPVDLVFHAVETTSSRLLTSRQLAGLEYLDIKINPRRGAVTHANVTGVEPGAVRHVRRRTRPPVRGSGRPGSGPDGRTARCVDLGCGPGNLTVTLRERLAGGDHRRRRQLAADDRGGAAVRRRPADLRARRPARVDRRAGVAGRDRHERDPAVDPRAARPAARLRPGAAPGRLAGDPDPRQRQRPVARDPARAGRHRAVCGVREGRVAATRRPRPGRVRRCAQRRGVRRSTRGRRRTSTCCTATTPYWSG